MSSKPPILWTDPTSWPWFFDLWVALIFAGWIKPLLRWFQRKQAGTWPTAAGEITSVAVKKTGTWFFPAGLRNKDATYAAELVYSYSVVGNDCAGDYKREFGGEEEAREFVRDLQGKPIQVSYNPNKPSNSALLESAIEALLRNRATKPEIEVAEAVPQWIRAFLWPFIGLSAIGLIVSMWVHLGAMMGRRVAPEAYFWILHVGIFVVWFPAVLVAQRRVGKKNSKDFWKIVLRGSPEWMRYVVYGFFGYAFVNFFYFFVQTPAGGTGANPPTSEWRGFSGHWMAFYSAAFAILYSAARGSVADRRCLNGHTIPPNTNVCPQCGQSAI